ncbi:hypothetical protein [Hymenobacter sp. CRA2]|uniref:hypothetical protein n=1 Tax=Hymenobacter sp. CRA2 TaxID=1955620 RepID=UPI00098FE09C|nr:hypothetical protein [Hymenobacter sp. CRA2]OON65865.1 hypothetical protein B0919_22820 [Hymenobacter sp. CRA2]
MAKLINVEVILLAFEETLIGAVTGVLGGVVGGLLGSVVDAGQSLYESVLFAVLGGALGLILGIARVGYKYLKENNCTERFQGQLVLGLAGMAVGAAVLYCSLSWLDTTAPAYVAPVVLSLPLLGLLMGFNHRIGCNRGEGA